MPPARDRLCRARAAPSSPSDCSAPYRYLDNYWLYRGFAPPRDPACVKAGARRRASTAERRARRPPPARRRLPAARLRDSTARRYPVIYLLHGVPGRPGGIPRDGARWASSRTSWSRAHRCAPMILVMPFGSTGSFTDKEWANGVRPDEGWETFVARDLVRAVDARYRTIRARQRPRARRAVGGRLRRAQHRAPPSRRVPRARELVGLRARRRPRLDLRPSHGGCSRGTARAAHARPRRAGAAARAHLRLVLQRHRRSASAARTRRSPPSCARAAVPHRFFVVRGGHNWAIWRGNAATRIPRGSSESSMCVEPRSRSRVPAARRRVAATGWLYLRAARRCPARGSATRCRSTSSAHAAVPLLWFVAVWGAAGAAARRCYARWARSSRLTAALLLGARRRASGASRRAASRSPSCARSRVRDALDVAAQLQAVYLPAAARRRSASPCSRPRAAAVRRAPLARRDGRRRRSTAQRPARDAARRRHRPAPPLDAGRGRAARARGRRARRRRAARRRARPRTPPPARVAGRDRRSPALLDAPARPARVRPRHARLGRRARRAGRPARTTSTGPATRRPGACVATRARVALAAIAAYGVVALWLNRMAADQPFTLGFALRETLDGVVGLHVRGSPHLAGPFGDWFPLSLLLLGGSARRSGSSPAGSRRGVTASARRSASASWPARSCTRGASTRSRRSSCAPTSRTSSATDERPSSPTASSAASRSSRATRSGRRRRSRRLVGSVRRARARSATGGSRSSARRSAASPLYARARPARPLPRRRGGRRDGVVLARGPRDPQGAPVGAPARARGLPRRASCVRARSTRALRAELEAGRARRGGATSRERGFVMALDALFRLGDEDAVFVVGFDARRPPAGLPALRALPRRRGAVALVDAAAALDAERLQRVARSARRSSGRGRTAYARVSLNFAPFAALLAPEAELSRPAAAAAARAAAR